MKFDPNTAVLANCSTNPGKTYPAGSLVISIGSWSGGFSIVVHEFIGLGEFENGTITGDGNLIASSKNLQRTFLVHTSRTAGGKTVYTYFEYANQEHLKSLVHQLLIASEKQNGKFLSVQNILERTEDPTYTEEIRCEIETFTSFGAVIHAYRSMQLENMVFPAH